MVVQAIQNAHVCVNAEAVDVLAARTRYPNVHLKWYAALPEAVLAPLIRPRDDGAARPPAEQAGPSTSTRAAGQPQSLAAPVDLGMSVALPGGRRSALNGEAFAVELVDSSESIRTRRGTLTRASGTSRGRWGS